MKILALSDLHIGESRESSTHLGIIRQANSQSLASLSQLIPKFNQMNFDCIVLLGDLIRDIDKTSDEVEMLKAVKTLSKLKSPIINIIGNHDIKYLIKEGITKILINHNFSSTFFGVKTFGETQIIWIDFEINHNGEVILPENQLKILEKELFDDTKKIIFSHHSLTKKNTQGNFYFEHNEPGTRYINLEEINSFLHKHSIKLAINGHEHWISHKLDEDINFLTLPSFSENIIDSANPDQCPGIYSILNIDDDQVVINSYSGDYSFFHLELAI
jgi:DNA repair exonuclease SbcCD nuclease subunit